jgi:hypothetical protein
MTQKVYKTPLKPAPEDARAQLDSLADLPNLRSSSRRRLSWEPSPWTVTGVAAAASSAGRRGWTSATRPGPGEPRSR